VKGFIKQKRSRLAWIRLGWYRFLFLVAFLYYCTNWFRLISSHFIWTIL